MLVSLAMVYVIGVGINKKPSSITQTYVETELAANMLNSLLKVTTTCNKESVNRLIIDCAEHRFNREYLMCGPGGIEPNSCDYVREEIRTMFATSLKTWGDRGFALQVSNGGTDIFDKIEGGADKCSKARRKEAKVYPLPSDQGNVIVKLEICSS